MKKTLFSLSAFAFLFVSESAFALIEARVTYGTLLGQPNLRSLYTGSMTAPSAVPSYGLGGDVLVFIPMTPWGVGLRYENLGFGAASSGLSYKGTAARTALLVNYRLIETVFYLGPIFSYGISHTNSVEVVDTPAGVTYRWEPDSSTSMQFGLDAGVKVTDIILGGEAGYESMRWSKMIDKGGVTQEKPDTEMTGLYLKMYVGYGFSSLIAMAIAENRMHLLLFGGAIAFAELFIDQHHFTDR